MADQDLSAGLVRYPTLESIVCSGAFTLPRALGIALALTDELRRCRDAGVFYPALSPDDVLIQWPDRVRIRPAVHPSAPRPRPPYASPEVVDGAAPDERAAVWQVGILLFELLAGSDQRKTLTSLAGTGQPLPSLRDLNPEIPEELELSIYRMLDRDPDLRTASLDEARHDVSGCLSVLQPADTTAPPLSSATGGRLASPRTMQSRVFASTPFIGRRSELAAIGAMIGESSCRLLTLTGPGGVGKSHLASEAAKDLARLFHDGSCVVPLNPVRSPAFMPLAIASALAFPLSGRLDPTEQLAGFLRAKKLLLVLDDFDQLIDGAHVVLGLLERTSDLKMLITSRQRLALRCECVLTVRGLPVPPRDTGDDAAEYDAVRLFLEHTNRMNTTVAAADTDVASVVRICRLLEGLPLGIEMAAGWTRVLTCAEILSEIERDAGILTTSARDVPEHHQSMAAVLSQSWRRLSDRERLVMGRLSVFGHGFRREAAEHVGADLPLLAGLTDKSLISRDTIDRYHLHELLRQFVGSQLSCDAEVLHQARRIHAEYFARYVHEKRRRLHQRGAEAVFDEMEEELANIRIGLDWSLAHLELAALEGYLSALHAFLHGRGWLAVDGQTLEQAIQVLRAASGGRPGAVEAARRLLGVALVLQADTHQALGKFSSARDRYEEGLRLLREHGTPSDLAMASLGLGGNAGREGHYEQAVALLDEALRHATAAGDQRILAQCCDAMGSIEMYRGGYANAQAWHARSLSILGEAGDRRSVAMALNNLGNASYCLGEMIRAREHYQAALGVNREIGSRRGIRTALGNLGNAAFSLDDFATARQCYIESLEVAREMGDEHGIAHALYQMGMVEGVSGNHVEAKRLNLESLEIHERTGERRGKGLALVSLSGACLALGERDRAIASVDAAVTLFRELGERWSLCTALEVAGDAHVADDATHLAIQAYREGLRIAVEIDARALIPGFASRFARILRNVGAHENATLLHAFILARGDAESKARREAADALRELEKEVGAAALEAATVRARSLTTESLIAEIEAAMAGLAPRINPQDP